jgi:dTDP-4-dehydrorhamnose reductase
MRLLILGGGGMLGHKLAQIARSRCETWVTVRGAVAAYRRFGIFDESRLIPDVDAASFDSVVAAVVKSRADVVVNCIGIVKQVPAAKDPIVSLTVNALFPHRVSALCRAASARFIHVSTDCVFSGRRGGYSEQDEPDGTDLYGRSKQLGEPPAPVLTLRTSMIGRELTSSSGLLEWFLAQRKGAVDGYVHARFSGLTTPALSRVILDIVERAPDLSGLYHLAAAPISKYDLLLLLRDALAPSTEICPRTDVRIDRTLDGSRLAAAIPLNIPAWRDMIGELAQDRTPYDEWRHARVA